MTTLEPESGAAPPSAQLLLEEAVLLCHAMVAHVAASNDVDVFFIKGPVSALQGLRPPKVSVDVDVMVPPASMAALTAALDLRGWRERPSEAESSAFPHHSVTLFHDDWPNNIDLHHRFPGMEAPAPDSFAKMWKRTQPATLAGCRLQVPERPLAIVFLALHALRSPSRESGNVELDFLLSLELAALKSEIIHCSTETGSLGALRPFLTSAFGEDCVPTWPSESAEWRNRRAVGAAGSLRAISILSAGWKERPKLVVRALAPSRESILGANLYSDMSAAGYVRNQARRWGRLLRALPQLTRDLRQFMADRSSRSE